jgi:hypothetical protein
MKTFILFLLFLIPYVGISQKYTIGTNYTYGLSVFNLDNTSFVDLRNERRFTSGYSYGLSFGKLFEKGYYQKKFWGLKLELNKFNYNQNFRIVPQTISLTSLKFIEKRIEVEGYSITPVLGYYPSVGQSLFIEMAPSFNRIMKDRQRIISNTVGFDSPLVPYEFRKIFISIYLRSGMYFNISDWGGITISIFSKTNISPISKDNSFNSYFFGGDFGLTFRLKK